MGKGHYLKSVPLISACTVASRVLGLVRLMLMAQLFGTSLVLSAFVLAFRLPNMFRRLFGEGALSAAFVPVFTEVLVKEGKEKAWRLATAVMTLMATVLGVVVIVVILGATALGHFPVGERVAAVLPLLRIMFPYMLFICLVALCMAILNSFRHFFVPAATPILLNIVWIGTLLVICPLFGATPQERIYGVAWGIVVAGALQLLLQLPPLLRHGLPRRFSLAWRDARVRRVLTLMMPAALGMGVMQVNTFLDSVLALWAAPWAPAALFYAEMMVYLPLGVFATALGTVLLPTLSEHAAREERERCRRTLNESMRLILFIMVPAAVGLCVLARPIIEVLFVWRGGEFGDDSLLLTARALRFYAPGLVVFGLYKVLVPALYAVQDTRTPVRIGVRVVGLNLAMNVAAVLSLPTGYKHAGLALSTVIASGVNCLALGRHVQRHFGSPGWRQILGSGTRATVAAAGMGVVAYALIGALTPWLAGLGLAEKLVQLLALIGAIAAGAAVYSGTAAILARRELRSALRAVRRR